MSDNTINNIDSKLLRLSAVVLILGELLFLVAGYFHPSREASNNHIAVFAEYANSSNWTAIHAGQFAGMFVIIAGFLILFFALNVTSGMQGLMARGGAVSAVVTLALYGVLQAVDGVALKQAVDSWASAPDAEKVVRFAVAEAIRWLEWGVRSYQDFMLGMTFIFFAIAIIRTDRIPRPIGYLMGLSGLGNIVQGWVTGSEGFSTNLFAPALIAYILWLAWSLSLIIFAWRNKEADEVPN